MAQGTMAKRRKHTRLAAGELEILQMLWREKTATIAKAHESLERKVGYTTVQTRLNRLVEKGLVHKTGSHPAQYRAAIRPEEVTRGDLEVLIKRVTGGRIVPLVAHLVRDRELSREEIRELRQLIDDAEQAHKKGQGQ
jgi:BlaI family penicillinase repressor